MSEGKNSWVVFNEYYKNNTNYEQLFTKVCQPPYKKSIMDRLCEKYPLPDFRCSAHYRHYLTHDDYIVSVKWGDDKNCKCIIF